MSGLTKSSWGLNLAVPFPRSGPCEVGQPIPVCGGGPQTTPPILASLFEGMLVVVFDF